MAGLEEVLTGIGCEVADLGDIPEIGEGSCIREPGGLVNIAPLMACIASLKTKVKDSLDAHNIPVVMGGDHSVVMGGIAAALDATDGNLAVVWIDAHADLNTPASSASGNLHGMPLAALAGLPSGVEDKRDKDWSDLLGAIGPNKLRGDRIAWVGLRDVDLAERQTILDLQRCLPITMHDIDRHGLVTMIERLDVWLRATGAGNVWISFDVDSLDPILAPGTGTAVRGGLMYREGHLLAELMRELFDAKDCPYKLLGVDIVETNPLADTNNETAKVAVEWAASLFGKTILGVSR